MQVIISGEKLIHLFANWQRMEDVKGMRGIKRGERCKMCGEIEDWR